MHSITNHFVRYYHGNLPIVLTAPHGGFEEPKAIKDRTTGIFEQDNHTLELTAYIIDTFQELIGKSPYGIIATITRKKVDLNRKASRAYEDERAKRVYDEFHYRIKKAEQEIEQRFGKGLYIDIHGQSHPNPYLEFGYLLRNETLKLPNEQLSQYQDKSSIRTLSNFSSCSFIDQIKGEYSLGTLISQKGYDSVPSLEIPFAEDGYYFEGAYDTRRYGSLDGSNISGVQIEFPYEGVRDSNENMQKAARAFVISLMEFFKIHLDIYLKDI